jgi:mRNA-degrading endonuclease toxin of MazEF toxin-antitoxin module
VPTPEQGRIILIEVDDPQKRNTKNRPAVIVSRTEEIESDGTIVCVAVTSSIPDNPPADCVLLPYHASGTTRTGLKKRSAAMCSWLFEATEEKITKYLGIVPPKQLNQILEYLEKQKGSN